MKYMGSKSRIAKYIVPIIQSYIDENNMTTYFEPFCGGCNVIDKIICNRRIAFDYNKYLIALLKRVQSNEPLLDNVSKELYDSVRNSLKDDYNFYPDWMIGNVGFLASYNGRWFDGGYAKACYENTKNGQRYRDYYREAKDNLLKQSPQLTDIIFKCVDYSLVHPKNSVIYCDPPYQNTTQYANAIHFDYEKFWNIMREWSKNNIVIISELNAPDDFECIWEREVSRSINANDKSRAVEKLFIHKKVEKE